MYRAEKSWTLAAVTEHPLEKPIAYFAYSVDAEEYAKKHGLQVIRIRVIESPESGIEEKHLTECECGHQKDWHLVQGCYCEECECKKYVVK